MTHGARTPRAFLLFHGLTASPRQFEDFGRTLHAQGANVYIPRLPRHGLADRLTTELGELTADELREFAEESLTHARTLGDRIVVVGFSVGGLLSAWLGQHAEVERATSIAPFLGLAWMPQTLTAPAARVALAMPNRFYWWDPRVRERQLPEHGYPRFATHAIAHAARLAGDLLAAAASSAPRAGDLQIVVNASESTVNNRTARTLAELWRKHREPGIVLHQLRGLPPSHDIIEPLRSPEIAQNVSKALVDLVAR